MHCFVIHKYKFMCCTELKSKKKKTTCDNNGVEIIKFLKINKKINGKFSAAVDLLLLKV